MGSGATDGERHENTKEDARHCQDPKEEGWRGWQSCLATSQFPAEDGQSSRLVYAVNMPVVRLGDRKADTSELIGQRAVTVKPIPHRAPYIQKCLGVRTGVEKLALLTKHLERSPTIGSMAQGLIEVERKFVPGPETEKRLQELGGTLEHRVTFRDNYYDTPELSLMRADHWLRQRENSGWELKCPGPAGVSGPHNEYRELTAASAIVAQLCEVLGVEVLGAGDVTAVLGPLRLQEVASFVTNRSTWKLVLSRADKEEPPLVVDLDTADFGYAVGEIEALVQEKAEVPAALEKIDRLGSMLGVLAQERAPAKLIMYLQRFRPQDYHLLEAHSSREKPQGTKGADKSLG